MPRASHLSKVLSNNIPKSKKKTIAMPYYAVAKGSKTGVYTNWNDCKEQVNGYSGASFKKFSTASEASAFVNGGGSGISSSSSSSRGGSSNSSSSSSGSSSYGGNSSSHSGSSYYNSGSSYYNSGSSYYDSGSSHYGGSSGSSYYGSSTVSNANTSKVSKPSKPAAQKVYVDGASRGNGRHAHPASGYGVYYGPGDSRNAAVPLNEVDPPYIKPTNQRAELHAAKHALKDIHTHLTSGKATGPTQIHSDSKYVVKSLNDWSDNWKSNGWKSTTGRPLANSDLIQEAVALKDKINDIYKEKNWGNVELVHVKGHAGDEGNEAADRLANLGADKMKGRK